MQFFHFTAIFTMISTSVVTTKTYHPLSDEFIDVINLKESTWTAGQNFKRNTSMRSIRSLAGVRAVKNSHKYPEITPDNIILPETFDARKVWADCADIIGNIRDQGNCGSCWAIAAISAMSDRICIHSNATRKANVSAQDLMTCCPSCGSCNGGYSLSGWTYWASDGIVTGNDYNSTSDCKAYSIAPCEHHVAGSKPQCKGISSTPECRQTCDDGSNLQDKRTFGRNATVLGGERQIQVEIYKNGPVEGKFYVYTDFLHYKSGVYQHLVGNGFGTHAIKIFGWGVERGTPYWLAANSWNTDWGDNGCFKIIRGENEGGIEDEIYAGLPLFENDF